MATLENPIAKERIVFLFADDTVLRFEEQVPPDHVPPPEHVHPHQQERFEVVDGRVTVSIDGRERSLGPGESLTIPARAPHTWHNSGAGTLRMITEFRPPLHMQDFFETYCGVAVEGRCDARGGPRFLQIVASGRWWDMYLAGPPIGAQKALFTLLRPLAWALGYRATYPRFRGTLTHDSTTTSANQDVL